MLQKDAVLRSVAFSPCGRVLACGTAAGEVILFAVQMGRASLGGAGLDAGGEEDLLRQVKPLAAFKVIARLGVNNLVHWLLFTPRGSPRGSQTSRGSKQDLGHATSCRLVTMSVDAKGACPGLATWVGTAVTACAVTPGCPPDAGLMKGCPTDAGLLGSVGLCVDGTTAESLAAAEVEALLVGLGSGELLLCQLAPEHALSGKGLCAGEDVEELLGGQSAPSEDVDTAKRLRSEREC
mmetsp:Transcript_59636/g.132796  ORF Transcript_59636/g.132796 Transcript_59636/m.132796 type:complete len:237 (-) Transcript_59636:28-738(-)